MGRRAEEPSNGPRAEVRTWTHASGAQDVRNGPNAVFVAPGAFEYKFAVSPVEHWELSDAEHVDRKPWKGVAETEGFEPSIPF